MIEPADQIALSIAIREQRQRPGKALGGQCRGIYTFGRGHRLEILMGGPRRRFV